MQSIDKQVYQAILAENGGTLEPSLAPLIEASSKNFYVCEYTFTEAGLVPLLWFTRPDGMHESQSPEKGTVVQITDGPLRGWLYEYTGERWMKTTPTRAALLTGRIVGTVPATELPIVYGRKLTNEHGFDSTKPQTLDFCAGIMRREPTAPDYRTTYSQATRDMVSEWLSVGGVTECEELYEEAKRRVERRGK